MNSERPCTYIKLHIRFTFTKLNNAIHFNNIVYLLHLYITI